jgi:tetratricopeptide (TPR) repeat protein
MRFKWLGIFPGFFCAMGCLTGTDKKELQDELFTTRTKILALESRLNEHGQRGSTTDQKIASSYVQIDTMHGDIQRVQGELDRLRIGVQSGRLPGGKEEDAYVANTLQILQQKIAELEKAQAEMLGLLSKMKTQHGAEKKTEKTKLKTGESIETAFKEKKYSAIVEEVPGLLKKKQLKHGDRAHYLYAESLFKLGHMEEAALEFDKLLKVASLSASFPKIQLRLGDCFRRLGDKATALVYYGELTAKFPHTPEAKSAEEQIQKLKK